ncbi:two-component regulator propeller domain-containing protein [Pontibacter sp. G13]|uniref:two-component regulator propeller domain-containing protein n=1 Tax=Pontibacter sp. G13 TaxID=3074898 RepID=UPI00288A98DD|nr:two-component regulator propeller domain-containing protein [Pontibacter sp. G13]WNJ20427.1 two-component regulator propeller domain-containing protein [Pontibacter sp. G13]
MTRLYLCICLWLFSQGLHAQWNELSVKQATTMEGLSHNSVQCVFEDSRGFIWLGTTDGLNRYDGHSFKTYQIRSDIPGALQSNSIYHISEDENQILWISSRTHEVCFFDLKKDRFVPADELPVQYRLPAGFVYWEVVHVGKEEHWICGKGDILISTPTGVKSLKQEGLLPLEMEIDIPKMVSKTADSVWVVVRSGQIFCMSRDDSDPTGIRIDFLKNNIKVNDLILYKNGMLLGTNEGILAKFPWHERPVKINLVPAITIYAQDETLWVGTREGIWGYQLDSLLAPFEDRTAGQLPTPHPLEAFGRKVPHLSSHVYNITEDRNGIIWIGTKGDGLLQFNPRADKFRFYSLGGEQRIRRRVRAILEDHQGRIWIGSDGKGMFRLATAPDGNRQLKEVHPTVNPNQFIHRLYELDLLGTPHLFQGTHFPSRPKILDISGDQPKEANAFEKLLLKRGSITDIIQDSQWIWISTFNQGVFRYNLETDEITEIKISEDTGEWPAHKPRSFLLDRSGRLWLGTSKGLFMIPANEKTRPVPRMLTFNHDPKDSTSLSHDYVLPLLQSSSGEIWIGTMGGGLNRWVEKKQRFEHWTTADGLSSNTLKGILEDDDGNLWISSNRGISQFDPSTERFINYDPSDGLQDYEFTDLSCYKTQAGEMLFGGVRGMNAFFPGQIHQDASVSPVIFTDLQVMNEQISPQQKLNGRVLIDTYLHDAAELNLRYDEHTFTISFVGLNYRSPKKIQYQYRLAGFEETWVHTDASARFAKYTKVPPGTYRFEVRASNTDGVWNGPTRSLIITIRPPFWQSNAAIAGYLVLGLLLIFFFRRYSLIRIQRKNEWIMQAFEQEKVQELAQMKLQFFTNVSHEFRTPLTLIQGYLDKVISTVNREVRQDLQIVQRNTRILLKLASELMDLQKMEQEYEHDVHSLEDLTILARESFDSFRWWAAQKDVQLDFQGPGIPQMVWMDTHGIERVCYNLLSNALKHTSPGGSIKIKIVEFQKEVCLSVQDTGQGIPKEDQAYVFKRFYQATKFREIHRMGTGIGLAYSKAIVERHQGKLYFESEEGVGTTFFLRLPKGSSYLSESQKDQEGQAETSTHAKVDAALLSKLRQRPEVIEPSELSPKAPCVLLVEDNHSIRSMLKEILSTRYRIVEAGEGEQALEMCIAHQPDLVVSDVMMPGMDGLAFCEALKQHEEISHIPVILLTAKDGAEMKQKGYEHGADAYVTKPFEMSVLQAQIQSIIESRQKLIDRIKTSGYEINLKDVELTKSDSQFMEQVLSVMEQHVEQMDFSVIQFAQSLNMSRATFNRKLKAMTGHTALRFMRDYRIKRAASLLSQSDLSIKEVFFQSGIANMKSFRQYFREEYGQSPREYRKNALTKTYGSRDGTNGI